MTGNKKVESAPILTFDDKVTFITFNRPSVANRLSAEDVKVVLDHIQTVNSRKDTSVLVFRSTGKYFCSGYDLRSLGNPEKPGSLFFGSMVDKIEKATPVTLAVIQGGVYGGATDLCLACDFRLGSENANMFMPATKLGLHFYPGGLVRYVTRLGLDVTKQLFMLSEKIDASKMLEIGFLTTKTRESELNDAVNRVVTGLSNMPPLALLGIKKHLNLIARSEVNIDEIEKNVLLTESSEDIKEGVLAWREKREPNFKGK